jgi:hypothetical protein
MKVTECGRKAVDHPQVRLMLLSMAHRWIIEQRVPEDDVRETLRFTVATYLAAVPEKGDPPFRAARGFELEDDEEFAQENAAIIDPIVEDTIASTTGMRRSMGME